jgi:hypothetical protein
MLCRFPSGATVAAIFFFSTSIAWASQRDHAVSCDGYTYNLNVIVRHDGDQNRGLNSRTKVACNQEREDFSRVTLLVPHLRDGSFMIHDRDENRSTFVYPDERAIVEEWHDLSEAKRPSMQTNGWQLEISRPQVRIRQLGDGGTVEGLPTQKTEVNVSFRRTIDVGGAKTSSGFKATYVIWTTDQIPGEAMTSSLKVLSGLPEEISEIIAGQKHKLGDGFVLKRETTFRFRKGGRMTSPTRTEMVTNFQREAIPMLEFQVPVDYEKMSRPPARR